MGRHSIPGPDDFFDDAPQQPDPLAYPRGGSDPDAERFTQPDGGYDIADDPGYDSGYAPADDSGYAPADDSGDPATDDRDRLVDPARYLRSGAAEASGYPFAPGNYRGPETPEDSADTGSHRTAEEWTGGHRFDGGRRGVSAGVIAALSTVIVLVGVVILWRFFGDSLSHRSQTAASRCVAGELGVAVVADPSIVDHVVEFATRFNKTAKPIADRCVSVQVRSADADTVVNGFIGEWPAQFGERPALWIPGSSVSTTRLTAATGQETVSDSRSLVTSPVMLAVRPQLASALDEKGWADLSGLQSTADSLGALQLPGWGSLRLALPTANNADAAFLAGAAVAEAAAGGPADDGVDALRTLLAGQPRLSDSSLGEALNTLLAPGNPADSPVHAVITTEQQIFQRGRSLSDAGESLTGWLPSGPAPVADYPTVLLNGSWLSQEQQAAASEFARFAHKADQLAELARAGFRVTGINPPSSEVTAFPAVTDTVSLDDEALRTMLANVLSVPSGNAAVTVMLDQSMTADEGGRTRLARVVAALNQQISELSPHSAVGLWTFDGIEGRSVVAAGALEDDVDGQPRSTTLTEALDQLSSSPGGAVSYTTLRLVYNEALANYREGQQNSVLVITAGPHTDRSLDGPGLQDFIRQTYDPDRPIAVNVIDFGDDSDGPTWRSVAELSGGTYTHLTSANAPALAAAVRSALR